MSVSEDQQQRRRWTRWCIWQRMRNPKVLTTIIRAAYALYRLIRFIFECFCTGG